MRIALTLAFCCLPLAAAAQATDVPFAVVGQMTGVASSEFDGTEPGFGGLFSWRAEPIVAIEAEANLYRSQLTVGNGTPFSRGMVEALFGVSMGPALAHVRPFLTFRTGVVQIRSAPRPIACLTIFPPTLHCLLAPGEAVLASVIGGGFEVPLARRGLLRAEVGDRVMHYPGAAIDAGGHAHNMAFYKNEFRFSAGAGIRF